MAIYFGSTIPDPKLLNLLQRFAGGIHREVMSQVMSQGAGLSGTEPDLSGTNVYVACECGVYILNIWIHIT